MIKKMSDADYFANPALNQSSFKVFLECPAKYHHDKQNPEPPTNPQIFGSLCHGVLLEPAQLGAHFEFIDEPTWKRTGAKEARTKALEAGLMPVLTHHVSKAKIMTAHLHSFVVDVPQDQREFAILGKINDVSCKAKIDWYDGTHLWDYKTTSSLSDWQYSFFKYGYDIQACWYLLLADELEVEGFRFLVQETEPPYCFDVFEPDFEQLKTARDIIIEGLEDYAKCTAQKHFPNYYNGRAKPIQKKRYKEFFSWKK